ncbi:MAG TPA: rRNA methyltransferase, partial [Rhodoglobus sp.]|nr:rRNA methyltransferase [Rhodoglobus sp.]
MHVLRITDLSDPRLGDYLNLTDVALRRVSEPAGGLYIAESSKVIARALAAGHIPRSALMLEQWLPDLEPLLAPFDIPLFVGAPDLLESLTGFSLHRGALASMHRPALPEVGELLRDARRVVVLEDIVDH